MKAKKAAACCMEQWRDELICVVAGLSSLIYVTVFSVMMHMFLLFYCFLFVCKRFYRSFNS